MTSTTPTNTQDWSLSQIKQVHSFLSSFYQPKSGVRGRKSLLKPPDIAIITLIQSKFQIKTLKSLYKLLKEVYLNIFNLPAYQNFVLAMNKGSVFLLGMIHLVLESGRIYLSKIKFIDSTPIPVCKIYRESSHRVMKLIASKKKSTTGWFYGLKLHLISDMNYNLTCFKFTTGSEDDRVVLNEFMDKVKFSDSTVVGDGGYVSKEYNQKFWETGTYFLTATRCNMKVLSTIYQNKLMDMRSKVETVFSILKDRFRLITSIPRSITGYLAHYIRTIFMYVFTGINQYLRIS